MKKGFILYLDSLSVLDELDDQQTAILFRALRDYNLGKEPELDFAMRMAFLPFKNQFIRDNEEYQKTCERNRNNGSKGGRPKNPIKPTETQKTHSVLEKPKKADKDNDKDNDKEKEQYIEPFEKRMVKFLNWFNHEFTRYQKPPTKFRTLNKQAQDNLKKLFNSKYTQEEWVHAFGNMIHNQWVIDNKTATPDHFLRVANFEKYLNQEATYTKVKKFKFPHS